MFERSIGLAFLIGVLVSPLPAATVATAADAPTIAQWVNQNVHMRQATEAREQPAADAKSVGGIMAGAEIKAIGIVAGGQWVQIELPNKALAYVPRAAVDLGGGAAAPPNPGPAPSTPATAAVKPEPTPAAGPAPGTVSGAVGRIPNAATLVVGDHRVRLWGIDPGPESIEAPFDKWLRENAGTLKCEPVGKTGRYKCVTADGHDIAEIALFSGFARVGEGAMDDYRKLEDQAREQHHGLWQQQ